MYMYVALNTYCVYTFESGYDLGRVAADWEVHQLRTVVKYILLQHIITLCITDNRSNPVSPEVELSQCLEPREVSSTRYIISSQIENSQVCQVTHTLYLTNLDE